MSANFIAGYSQTPKFRHVERVVNDPVLLDTLRSQLLLTKKVAEETDSIVNERDTVTRVRTLEELLDAIPVPDSKPTMINRLAGPWIFSGYRHLSSRDYDVDLAGMTGSRLWGFLPAQDSVAVEEPPYWMPVDTLGRPYYLPREELTILEGDITPAWLRSSLTADRIQQDVMYKVMIKDPSTIDFAYWNLPEPPRLPADDESYLGYVKRLNLPEVDVAKAVIYETATAKRHWLHVVNTGLQFSQAYISKNWYQGGSDYLALLFNFLWDVQLNTVYHPNLLFQSTLSYKLGINSQNDDQYHKYSVSQDLFQYNAKLGIKAKRNWYYSLTTQFKTQLLPHYPSNTPDYNSSFLTPGDLNFGIGMTYSKTNSKKTLQFNASIAPLSYNLKMCIDRKVDHTQYNVPQDKKFNNEFGSNAEITFNWTIGKNVSYKTRLFLFTDYSYFQGDWENTLNFQFNRFFSTQIYANLRYDTSADITIAPSWKRWMLKEILSVGFSYNFSTKQ